MPRILRNVGTDRLLDVALSALRPGSSVDAVLPRLSLFGFEALSNELERAGRSRLILPANPEALELFGTEWDRERRNLLAVHHLARELLRWIKRAESRAIAAAVPGGALVVSTGDGTWAAAQGTLALTTDGLGITPGNPLGLVTVASSDDEATMIAAWFEAQWSALASHGSGASELAATLEFIAASKPPALVYAAILRHLFQRDGELDEERVLRGATGIRETAVWRKLYRFQRDGVLGILDTLERFGGCILADSVGLGKTFEALAVIKHHELRNDRVLVLCPKRLRDNWVLYKANDTRNILAGDRFNYDVLNHTDLSRDGGLSGDIDLTHVNWGNYDLVVIDESHNFRNKKTPRAGGETRYDRLMRRIIQEGVKTRVLMLSATPVNNRLADLRNQIAFATEGRDDALRSEGVDSIDVTTRRAQEQFNRWQKLPEPERTPAQLVEMFGFDYFRLLDRLTIARSRKHVEKYYGTAETGRFADRLPPINVKKGTDLAGEFPPIEQVNLEIRKLTLAAYQPLSYVLRDRQAAYDAKYSVAVKGGKGVFRQQDREQSLVHLMRVNLLKRMESSVASFALTVSRQLHEVESLLARIDATDDDAAAEEPDLENVDLDDTSLESLVVGRNVRVLLADVDRRRWRQDLAEDRNRLGSLHAAATTVSAERDEKLQALRAFIHSKAREPINPGNRKILIFSAFADTARYLYDQLAPWALSAHGLHSALVTGSGGNQTTLPGLRRDLGSILSAFAPRARERPASLASEGELELIFATDCISEGQNLQDCDCVVNYDIHWNPVRIIQRFGRIDRLGTTNARIQLVNFWPNLELDEYIRLEQRVSGRMTLLDVSATGEENLIEAQSGDTMNDFAYRRAQLLKLREQVIDIEDISAGISISDLTLSDFRVDLARFAVSKGDELQRMHPGAFAVTITSDSDLEPGVIFCLRMASPAAQPAAGYPLAPWYLVHVSDAGTVALGYAHAKRILERLRRLCAGHDLPHATAASRFDAATREGGDMTAVQRLLGAAVASITGVQEERAVATLFTAGGTATPGGPAGTDAFEVEAFVVILPAA